MDRKSFEEECRAKFNDICLVHDHQLGRLVGIHEDSFDMYYIVRVPRYDRHRGIEIPEGGREYMASAVGWCSSMRGHERYDALEGMFTCNGCPPAAEFIITRDDRTEEEQMQDWHTPMTEAERLTG